MLGGHDGIKALSSGRQGRVLESQGACKHRVNHERQNAYILPFGSKQLYTAAFGRRYPLYDERERRRHSEYGRKPQRIVVDIIRKYGMEFIKE